MIYILIVFAIIMAALLGYLARKFEDDENFQDWNNDKNK